MRASSAEPRTGCQDGRTRYLSLARYVFSAVVGSPLDKEYPLRPARSLSYSAARGLGQLECLVCDSGGGGFAVAGNLHRREREFDAIGVERFLIMASACRRIGKFSPGKVIIFIRSCTAKSPSASTPCIFNGSMIIVQFGVLRQVETDLLDQLFRLVDVAVIGDADRQLVDGPVAALVLDGAQKTERHGVERAALMAQPDRAKAEGFDGALVVAALDVFADPEGVVEQ